MRPVFSFWAWLALTPYLLVPLGGLGAASTSRQWLAGVTTSLVVHLVLLAAFLIVGALEVAASARSWLRWTIVGLGLVGMAVGRPILLSAVQDSLGLDLMPWTHGPARIVLNAIAIGIGVGLTYLLLDTVARAIDSRARLHAVLARLEAQARQAEVSADRLADAFHAQVRAPVVDALRDLESRGLAGAELAGELQRIAHTVVRPLSHRVTAAGLEQAIAPDARLPAVEPAAPRTRLPRARRITPPPASLTAIVTALLLLPPVLDLHGPWPGVGLLAIAAATAFLGGLVIRAIHLPRSVSAALGILALEQLLVGSVVLAVLVLPLPPTPLIGYYLVYGVVGYATVAVALAIIRGSLREIAEDQEATAAALGRTERAAFDARQRLASLTRDTGRLLHTEIQGDLVATYLQVRLGTAGEDVLPRLIERVERLLDAEPAAAQESAAAIRDGLRASLDAWSRSLDLSVDLEPAALDRIAGAAGAASVAHDALTEGLTNAVRHSRSDRARVRIGLAHGTDDVEVVVTSPGRIVAADRGIGLRDLDARARAVSLTQQGADVVLRVLV